MDALQWVADNLPWVQSLCRRIAGHPDLADDLYGECIDVAPRLGASFDYAKCATDDLPTSIERYMRRSLRLFCLKRAVHLRGRSARTAAEFNDGAPIEFAYSVFAATETTNYDATGEESNKRITPDTSIRSVTHYECEQDRADCFDAATLVMRRVQADEKLLLIQYFWQGMSCAEIAEATGSIKITVYKKLQRVITFIRESVNAG